MSQERQRLEAKKKREAQLRIVELEEAKELAVQEQKAKAKLQETENFLQKKGIRSVSRDAEEVNFEDSLNPRGVA